MNREIKFRTFDLRGRQMDYSCENISLFNGKVCVDGVVAYQVKVMQFTGLLDKNGKEIYEGDLVTVSYATQWHKYKAIECVVFEEGQFITDKGHKLGRKGTEVVGNIYENHELL